MRIYMAALHRN